VFVDGIFLPWLCDGSRTFTFVIQQPKPFVVYLVASVNEGEEAKNNKEGEEGFVIKTALKHQ
jgi:hypothetical protein